MLILWCAESRSHCLANPRPLVRSRKDWPVDGIVADVQAPEIAFAVAQSNRQDAVTNRESSD